MPVTEDGSAFIRKHCMTAAMASMVAGDMLRPDGAYILENL